MKYKATKLFDQLDASNHHQNLERQEFLALKRGETVEIQNVPVKLIDGKFLVEVKKASK